MVARAVQRSGLWGRRRRRERGSSRGSPGKAVGGCWNFESLPLSVTGGSLACLLADRLPAQALVASGSRPPAWPRQAGRAGQGRPS